MPIADLTGTPDEEEDAEQRCEAHTSEIPWTDRREDRCRSTR
jgi:hypothetical protein